MQVSFLPLQARLAGDRSEHCGEMKVRDSFVGAVIFVSVLLGRLCLAQMDDPAAAAAAERSQYQSRRNDQWRPALDQWERLVGEWETGNYNTLCSMSPVLPTRSPITSSDGSTTTTSPTTTSSTAMRPSYTEQLAVWDELILEHQERMYRWQVTMRSLVCAGS